MEIWEKSRGKNVPWKTLSLFSQRVFEKMGCNPFEAGLASEVLVEADLRGIHSHGVSRLGRYIYHIEKGVIMPNQAPTVV